jgi:asparagine synthase (glutamine-hydrolysing)
MGGVHTPWGFDPRTRLYSFDTLFQRLNRYGFSPEQIRTLVRPDVLNGELDAALHDLRATYDGLPGLPFQKVWLFDLMHRNRFHNGSIGWEASSGAWAALPLTGPALVDLAANMPANTIGEGNTDRRVQVDLLCRHGLDLAQLPLDRNSRTDLAPVRYRSTLHRNWDQKVMSKVRRVRRNLEDRRGVDSRYFYRVYDINNAGWRAVRRAAEPYRKVAESILRPEALREVLPGPDETIRLKDGIVDAARLKTLIGFMLWAGKHL